MSKKQIVLIMLLMANVYLSAAGYYVSPSGKNTNNGTIQNPFKTIAHGESRLRGGDTLFILAGRYNEIVRIFGVSGGTEEKPTVITAYNKGVVIIDGKDLNVGNGSALVRSSNSHSQFIGLTVINSNKSGIMLDNEAHFSKVLGCTVNDIWEAGIYGFGDNCSIEDCVVFNTAMSNGDGVWQKGEIWSGGISCRRNPDRPVTNCLIKGCTVHDVWGEGIDMAFSDNGIIEGNIVYDIYSVLIYSRNNTNILIQRNLIYMTKKMGDGSSVGIGHWNEGSSTYINNYNKVINNIVFQCRRNLYHYGETSGLLIAHNTFVNSSYFSGVQINDRKSIINSLFINNIIIQENGIQPIWVEDGNGVKFDNNLYNKVYDSDAIGYKDIIGNPGFSSKGNLGPGTLSPDFFKLLATSPAINKGSSLDQVKNDFCNNHRDQNPDLGAYEYIGLKIEPD